MTGAEDDGRTRCGWADATGSRAAAPDSIMYRDYHDTEWGRPLHGAEALFERMSLEAFQSGLSWLIILRKRDNFRRAFKRFDIEKVARFDDRDVERLMNDQGIVRNRAKVDATLANAKAVLALDEPLADLIWRFAPADRPAPVTMADVPAQTAESKALSKALKANGLVFVGPTTAYALMQAVGLVNDHLADCWVRDRVAAA